MLSWKFAAAPGGEEAALFAYNLYRMYNMYAEKRGWKTEIVSLNETELGGFKEVSFTIDGDGAYSRLKFESGVHRVQRVPGNRNAGPHPHKHRHGRRFAGSR